VINIVRILYFSVLAILFFGFAAQAIRVSWDLDDVKEGDKYQEEIEGNTINLNIEKLVGSGSYGKVYSGNLNGRPVAIKYINGKNRASAVRESSRLSSLSEVPGVVNYISDLVDKVGNTLLVMELLKPLKDLSKGKKIDKRFTLSALLRLKGIHNKGYVHGDIKPDNLMLSNSDNLVFIDFGGSELMGTKAKSTPFYSYRFSGLPEGDLRSLAIALLEIRHKPIFQSDLMDIWERYHKDNEGKFTVDNNSLKNYSELKMNELAKIYDERVRGDVKNYSVYDLEKSSTENLIKALQEVDSQDSFFREIRSKIESEMHGLDGVDKLLFDIINGRINSIQEAVKEIAVPR